MKQVAYVNYTLNEFEELFLISEDFMFVVIVNLSKAL